jgi:hypothetical protein
MLQRDPAVILNLVDKVYAAAPDRAVWADFLSSAAEAVGADQGSARQYLKRVFEKTGAKRQLDLIRVIEGVLARNG